MSKFRVLIISFFLVFTTTFVHAKEVVTDVNGNELRSGARYYMLVPPPYSGLMYSAISDTTHGFCPSGEVIISDLSYRLPISITPVKDDSSVIHEDTYVTVRFNFSHPCLMLISLVWRVDRITNRVTTGGVERVNRFKIMKSGGEGSNNYHLAACPKSECWPEDCRCERVDYVEDNGVRYLQVVGANPLFPFPIVFEPVHDEARIANKLPSM